jgi:7,8-dihydro-6-hydroxymethylpterin-pyrophosphokinase
VQGDVELRPQTLADVCQVVEHTSRRTRQHPTNTKPRILRFTAADLLAVGVEVQ